MQWQPQQLDSVQMAGNMGMGLGGGNGGMNGAGNAGQQGSQQPAGTEYTLQGVMRFLQTEWHRHERDRNEWAIERAEMRSRIAKLEGSYNAEKRLQKAFQTRIKMLEKALKEERTMNGKGVAISDMPSKLESGEKQADDPSRVAKTPLVDGIINPDPLLEGHTFNNDMATENRIAAKVALEQCIREINFLLAAPANPGPPPPLLYQQQNHQPQQYSAQLLGPQAQQSNSQGFMLDPNAPLVPQNGDNGIPLRFNNNRGSYQQQNGLITQGPSGALPQIPARSSSTGQMEETNLFARQAQEQQLGSVPLLRSAGRQSPSTGMSPDENEQNIEKITHSFDKFGQQLGKDNTDSADKVASTSVFEQYEDSEDDGSVREGSSNGSSSDTTIGTDSYPSPLYNNDESDHRVEDMTKWDFDETTRLPGADGDDKVLDDSLAESFGGVKSPSPPLGAGAELVKSEVYPITSTIAPSMPLQTRFGGSHRRKSSIRRKSSSDSAEASPQPNGTASFKVRYALRGHLDVVRTIIFTGLTGDSLQEPEIATAGDDGVIKRWYIPKQYNPFGSTRSSSLNPSSGGGSVGTGDNDITAHFTHRGHIGMVSCLASSSAATLSSDGPQQNLMNPYAWSMPGGRLSNPPPSPVYLFSGGQDTTVKVWESERVDAKATLVGHTDTVWAVCVLPENSKSIFQGANTEERIVVVSGAADGEVKIWAVTPPAPSRSHTGSFRQRGPYFNKDKSTNFSYELLSTISRPDIKWDTISTQLPSPTSICALSPMGDNFAVAYNDAAILVYDTRTGEQLSAMMSNESDDSRESTSVNKIVTIPQTGADVDSESDEGATGRSGLGGTIISAQEDQLIRFFDANSGQCTYSVLAHPTPIGSIALSPDQRELVSGGHDGSVRIWSLETRTCVVENGTSHRIYRGEGVCAVVWSPDGRWILSAGGDGGVKVFSR